MRGEPKLVDVIREVCKDVSTAPYVLLKGFRTWTQEKISLELRMQLFLHARYAEVLVTLLHALPTPVIPARLHQRCIAQTERDESLEVRC